MPKIVNPYSGSLFYEYDYDNLDIIEKKICKLDCYQAISLPKRVAALKKLASLLHDNLNDLAKVITQETGKTICDARIELSRAITTIEMTISVSDHLTTESHSIDEERDFKTSILKRFPFGLIFCITPFNFPINLALHKIAPAFLCGNSILLKPAECNFKSMNLFLSLCYQAGFPTDSIEMTMPEAKNLKMINSDKRIKLISFTGGTKSADLIAMQAGRKKLLFELGGNAPLIIYPDADLTKTIETAIIGRFYMAGQKCTSNKRVFVHADIFDQFKEGLIAKTQKLLVGDPLNEKTHVGPVVNEQSAIMLLKEIEILKSEGVKVIMGGTRDGSIVMPTIVENIKANSYVHKNEIFGPIIPLISFETEQEVIDLVNSSPYGLQAGIFTNNLSIIKNYFNKLETGSVIINDGPGLRYEHLPFGGVKDSGFGREGIRYAIDEMSYQKQLIF